MLSAEEFIQQVSQILTKAPPYSAAVIVDKFDDEDGWASNVNPNKVVDIMDKYNQQHFSTNIIIVGSSGSIPLV